MYILFLLLARNINGFMFLLIMGIFTSSLLIIIIRSALSKNDSCRKRNATISLRSIIDDYAESKYHVRLKNVHVLKFIGTAYFLI